MISDPDRKQFREAVARYAEIGRSDVITERIRLWKRHNSLRPERPMLLVFPEGSWEEISRNAPEFQRPLCEDPLLARLEWQLLSQIYAFEHFQTDNTVDRFLRVPKTVADTGWGLTPKRFTANGRVRGAWKHDPVIIELEDLKNLRMPDVIYDEEKSTREFELIRELVGDLIEVRSTGVSHVSFHLMNEWSLFRGLEQIMMDMVENPEWLHEAIAFLAEGNRRKVGQYEKLGLLELNNDNTYHSSGGNGWTDELPAPGFDGRVRPIDMWVSAEVQELTMVSPEMQEEFALRYERELIKPFGLAGYGCCDDLTLKLADILKAPNMRRISISPYADVDRCAPQLGGRCIFSWKPRPTDLVGGFYPDRIREYIRHTLEVAAEHGCVLEMILKDTHTCEGKIDRFDAWCKIAREEIAAMYGAV